MKALDKARPNKVGIYNVGTGKGCSPSLFSVCMFFLFCSMAGLACRNLTSLLFYFQEGQSKNLSRPARRQLRWTSKLTTLNVDQGTMPKSTVTLQKSIWSSTGPHITPIFKRASQPHGDGRNHIRMVIGHHRPCLFDQLFHSIIHIRFHEDVSFW